MENKPYLELTWHDPESKAQGYLVIDTLVRGVAGKLKAPDDVVDVRNSGTTLYIDSQDGQMLVVVDAPPR